MQILIRFFFLQNITCSDKKSNGLFAIQSPTQNLGGRERLYRVTLLACGMSAQEGRGLYKCSLNRSRRDPYLVWSFMLLSPEVEITTSSLDSTKSPLPTKDGTSNGSNHTGI